MTVEEAALGALQIQKFGMTQAIELNSVRRGYDPRDFTLVAAGGAGPLFACDIALELEIPRVLVPAHPGIIAATGLLATDLQHEFVATERHPLKALDHDATRGPLRRARARRPSPSSTRTACPRTSGSYGASPTAATRARATRCASTCRPARSTTPGSRSSRSASTPPTRRSTGTASTPQIEIINIRVVAVGRVDELQPTELEQGDGDPARAMTLEREVVFEVDGARRAPRDPVLRARAAARRRPYRRAGDHRAVRLHDRRAARADRRGRPLRQHRHRLQRGRDRRRGRGRAAWPRRSSCA